MRWWPLLLLGLATVASAVDTTAPSVPRQVRIWVYSPTRIHITWATSTDDTGVTNYDLQRCSDAGCSSVLATINIANGAATDYTDTGLTALTTYYYRVRASDAATNHSAYSGTVQAITQSTMPLGAAWGDGGVAVIDQVKFGYKHYSSSGGGTQDLQDRAGFCAGGANIWNPCFGRCNLSASQKCTTGPICNLYNPADFSCTASAADCPGSTCTADADDWDNSFNAHTGTLSVPFTASSVPSPEYFLVNKGDAVNACGVGGAGDVLDWTFDLTGLPAGGGPINFVTAAGFSASPLRLCYDQDASDTLSNADYDATCVDTTSSSDVIYVSCQVTLSAALKTLGHVKMRLFNHGANAPIRVYWSAVTRNPSNATGVTGTDKMFSANPGTIVGTHPRGWSTEGAAFTDLPAMRTRITSGRAKQIFDKVNAARYSPCAGGYESTPTGINSHDDELTETNLMMQVMLRGTDTTLAACAGYDATGSCANGSNPGARCTEGGSECLGGGTCTIDDCRCTAGTPGCVSTGVNYVSYDSTQCGAFKMLRDLENKKRKWPSWIYSPGGNTLDQANTIMGAAVSYDAIVNGLNAKDREGQARKLASEVLRSFNQTLTASNQTSSKIESNWREVITGAEGIAALVLDNWQFSSSIVQQSVEQARSHLSSYFAPSGGPAETFGYSVFSNTYMTMFLQALQQCSATTHGASYQSLYSTYCGNNLFTWDQSVLGQNGLWLREFTTPDLSNGYPYGDHGGGHPSGDIIAFQMDKFNGTTPVNDTKDAGPALKFYFDRIYPDASVICTDYHALPCPIALRHYRQDLTGVDPTPTDPRTFISNDPPGVDDGWIAFNQANGDTQAGAVFMKCGLRPGFHSHEFDSLWFYDLGAILGQDYGINSYGSAADNFHRFWRGHNFAIAVDPPEPYPALNGTVGGQYAEVDDYVQTCQIPRYAKWDTTRAGVISEDEGLAFASNNFNTMTRAVVHTIVVDDAPEHLFLFRVDDMDKDGGTHTYETPLAVLATQSATPAFKKIGAGIAGHWYEDNAVGTDLDIVMAHPTAATSRCSNNFNAGFCSTDADCPGGTCGTANSFGVNFLRLRQVGVTGRTQFSALLWPNNANFPLPTLTGYDSADFQGFSWSSPTADTVAFHLSWDGTTTHTVNGVTTDGEIFHVRKSGSDLESLVATRTKTVQANAKTWVSSTVSIPAVSAKWTGSLITADLDVGTTVHDVTLYNPGSGVSALTLNNVAAAGCSSCPTGSTGPAPCYCTAANAVTVLNMIPDTKRAALAVTETGGGGTTTTVATTSTSSSSLTSTTATPTTTSSTSSTNSTSTTQTSTTTSSTATSTTTSSTSTSTTSSSTVPPAEQHGHRHRGVRMRGVRTK